MNKALSSKLDVHFTQIGTVVELQKKSNSRHEMIKENDTLIYFPMVRQEFEKYIELNLVDC